MAEPCAANNDKEGRAAGHLSQINWADRWTVSDIAFLGDAVFIRLSQQKNRRRFYTLIDRDDFERVTRSKWYFNQGYAFATTCKYLPKHHKRLHAFVLKAEPGQIIDHISGDRLDNRKQNLRIVTQAENAKNARRPTFPGKTSRFKGVCWSRHDGKWFAQIGSDNVRHDLGLHDDEVAAAQAYDVAALRLHGEFARTNEMMKLYEQPDPFVPDCSYGARASNRQKRKQWLEPHHEFNNQQRNREMLKDQRLRQEVAEMLK